MWTIWFPHDNHIIIWNSLNTARPCQHDMFMGQFHEQLGYRLEAIKSISLISLHYATRGPTPSLLSSLSPPRFPLSLLSHPISLLSLSSSSVPAILPIPLLLLFFSSFPLHLAIWQFQAHVNLSLRSCSTTPHPSHTVSYYTEERRGGWDVHWDLRIKLYLLQCIPTLKAGTRYAIPKEYHWVRTSKLGTSSLRTRPHQVSDGLADLFPPVSDFHLPASP